MASADFDNVPVENTVRALRRLAPGARLREPRTPELRVLARALRDHALSELARTHPVPVARAVLAGQLRALDRAVLGLFAADQPDGPAAARLVRAARYGRTRRAGPLPDRLRAEPGLRAAALGWAEAGGHRILAGELRGIPEVPAPGDGRLAAELAVAALLPPPDRGGRVPSGDLVRTGSAFLDVRSLRIGDHGFRVDVESAAPVEVVRDEAGLTLRALWWKGLGRVTDDLGHEYLVLAKDPAGTPTVRHWCHPRPAPGARVLRLESAGYRGERLRLGSAPAGMPAGTSADVLVKLELTVRLGA